MDKKIHRVISFTAAVLMLTGCASGSESSNNDSSVPAEEISEAVTTTVTTAEEPEVTEAVTFAPKEKQVVNETPATYESFGIDKAEKDAFREKIMEKSDIPVISITTNNKSIVSLDEYISCIVDVFNVDEQYEISEASAGARVRGNSSAFYGDLKKVLNSQVPYRIRFDEKTNLLGLNNGAKCRSWVLLKADWDLIRNDIAFRFGRTLMEEDGYFCSGSQLVHVYVNEKFQGIYTLCEQCQVNENRVDISEPEEGYTGTDIGYYLELDNYATGDEDHHYITLDYDEATVADIEGLERQFVPAEYSIKNEVYSQAQIDFIEKYMNNMFTIVYEACENGRFLTYDENFDLIDAEYTTAEETVDAVMDIQSVVDMYILYEIVHDYDCGEGSFFMCVDMSEGSKYPKLTFTSPWDFNWAYNDAAKNKYWAAAFTAQSFVDQYGDRTNPWFVVLYKQDWFQDRVKEKWRSVNKDGQMMDCLKAENEYLEAYRDDLCKTDEWAVDSAYKLEEWIFKRLEWLDEIWLEK